MEQEENFETMASRLRGRLVRQAAAITGSDAEGSDIAQDTLLTLWEHRATLHRYRSVDALAYVVCRRLAINALRRRRPQVSLEVFDAGATESIPSPEDLYISAETAGETHRILSLLPAPQAALVRMRHIDGYDNATIAALTGSTEGAVRTALSRARHRIAEIFLSSQNNYRNNNSPLYNI
ncbi:MAG: RNA polymerase sigma factor [Muribaculaceae bacterium]|nr:RNA polymerase sigma factor [Muribaculaceae bacterium]